MNIEQLGKIKDLVFSLMELVELDTMGNANVKAAIYNLNKVTNIAVKELLWGDWLSGVYHRSEKKVNKDEEVERAWLELCNSTSSPFWPAYEKFKKEFVLLLNERR